MKGLLITIGVLTAAVPAQSQTDPIRCWWRSSHGAVATGESFTATLTCAVREQASTRTVPDESRLDAAVVQLAPFEVLAGDHPADLRSPTHRFFQYRYTLRIIDRDVIGHDARFPDVQIPYRVQTFTNGEWMAGRDRTYVMPGQSVRVLSLVPADADDIRDSTEAAFGEVAALRFRARAVELAAYALLGLGVIAAVPAMWALSRRRVVTADEEASRIPRRALAAAVNGELDAVDRERAAGWSPDLVARSLMALRLAAAIGLNRGVSSHVLDDGPGGTGRVRLRRGLWRKNELGVSSALTPADIRAALADLPGTTPAARGAALGDLADSMSALSAALYGQTFAPDDRLDAAFGTGRGAAQLLTRR
jgi:hypothetical protein